MWPLVIGGYSGAALAFTAALFWDRHSRLQDEVRQAETDGGARRSGSSRSRSGASSRPSGASARSRSS